MVKSPELSDVTDRAKCSTEMKERRRRRSRGGQSKLLLYGKSGKGGREREGGGAGVEAVGKRNDGKRGA